MGRAVCVFLQNWCAGLLFTVQFFHLYYHRNSFFFHFSCCFLKFRTFLFYENTCFMKYTKKRKYINQFNFLGTFHFYTFRTHVQSQRGLTESLKNLRVSPFSFRSDQKSRKFKSVDQWNWLTHVLLTKIEKCISRLNVFMNLWEGGTLRGAVLMLNVTVFVKY